MMTKECLIIGPDGSGKTLLIRKILSINDNKNKVLNDNDDEIIVHENTMPTVGIDINTIILNDNNIMLREIGGSMISRWSYFIDTCDTLIFVIDISDMSSLSTSFVLLMEMFTIVLKSTKKLLKDIAVSFTKSDLSDISSQNIAKNILAINDLIYEGKRNGINVHTFEGNSLDNSLAAQCINYLVCNM